MESVIYNLRYIFAKLTSRKLHQVPVIPFVHSFQRLLHIPIFYDRVLLFVQKQFVDNESYVRIQRGVVKDSTDLQSVT